MVDKLNHCIIETKHALCYCDYISSKNATPELSGFMRPFRLVASMASDTDWDEVRFQRYLMLDREENTNTEPYPFTNG